MTVLGDHHRRKPFLLVGEMGTFNLLFTSGWSVSQLSQGSNQHTSRVSGRGPPLPGVLSAGAPAQDYLDLDG